MSNPKGRNAVIVVDVILVILNAYLLIVVSVEGDDFLNLYGFIAGSTVATSITLCVLSLVMACVSCLGAMVDNARLVLANALWLLIWLVLAIVRAVGFKNRDCSPCYSPGPALRVSGVMILTAIAVVGFMLLHVQFWCGRNEWRGPKNCCCICIDCIVNSALVHAEHEGESPRAELAKDSNSDVRSEIDAEAPLPPRNQTGQMAI